MIREYGTSLKISSPYSHKIKEDDMSDRASKCKKRRDELKQLGLCIECGKEPTATGVRCGDCKQRQKERNKRYKKKHRKRLLVKNREWMKNNPRKWKSYGLKYRRKLREKVIAKFGGKCECCGETTLEWLQLDHVDCNGKRHREEVGRGVALHRDLLRGSTDYKIRILCANCHNAITCYGVCPHEKKISKDSTSAVV